MEMTIEFPGGDRVDAVMNGVRLVTDQDGSSPSPFQLFLASIGTCAGIYVSSFLRQRNLPTAGLVIRQRMVPDPATRLIGRIELDIDLPPGVPDQYRGALIRAAQLCAVKKHLERPPEIEVRAN